MLIEIESGVEMNFVDEIRECVFGIKNDFYSKISFKIEEIEETKEILTLLYT